MLRNPWGKVEYHFNAFNQLPESDRYTSTTYQYDYKIRPDIAGPPESARMETNLKCEPGTMEKKSTYFQDFIKWPEEDMEFCRAKACRQNGEIVDDLTLKPPVDVSKFNPRIYHSLERYYCPPNCVGAVAHLQGQKCLAPHKERFNLGPPTRKDTFDRRPKKPFSKYSSYMLDYIPHEVEPSPSSKEKGRKSGLGQPVSPTAFDTLYKREYVWPPKISNAGKAEKPKSPTPKVGKRQPMSTVSSHMTDYKDPKVTERMPIRHPKDPFVPPTCRMESETTSGNSFPRWKELPPQEVAKPIKDIKHDVGKSDERLLVSTYQEDFHGLRAALCPAKTIEHYGRLAKEPKYQYVCSDYQHEHYEHRPLTNNKT
ncbi:uncharacterized protein TNIN_459581 [Trichonephila inaurata madagascariensis]|uniref:Uncharacterized protein n=1 Tax=Trichonephila inaurata madagascariensis TaxID=2747483 RepID=A0A8X6XRT6_9ARAC|nr:uncharacterized protein TNIN_459581 [Trichonephila inaurata madagascariensis]